MRTAYVDESFHVVAGVCIVAVAVIDRQQEGPARASLAALLPSGAKRLHWQSNGTALRTKAVGVAVAHITQARAYVSYFDSLKRQDQARERCLEHLILDLGGPPTGEIILDQRTPHQDTRDDQALDGQCNRLRLPHPPTWRHDGTLTEPLLWLADTIAGAIGEHMFTRTSRTCRLSPANL